MQDTPWAAYRIRAQHQQPWQEKHPSSLPVPDSGRPMLACRCTSPTAERLRIARQDALGARLTLAPRDNYLKSKSRKADCLCPGKHRSEQSCHLQTFKLTAALQIQVGGAHQRHRRPPPCSACHPQAAARPHVNISHRACTLGMMLWVPPNSTTCRQWMHLLEFASAQAQGPCAASRGLGSGGQHAATNGCI